MTLPKSQELARGRRGTQVQTERLPNLSAYLLPDTAKQLLASLSFNNPESGEQLVSTEQVPGAAAACMSGTGCYLVSGTVSSDCMRLPRTRQTAGTQYKFAELMNTRPQVTFVPYSPENKGQIFSQQVMPPSEVYWPMITSRKNTGRPPPNRKMKYGMRNAPAERAKWGEGQTGAVTGGPRLQLLTPKPSQPMESERMSEGREGREG